MYNMAEENRRMLDHITRLGDSVNRWRGRFFVALVAAAIFLAWVIVLVFILLTGKR